jgi:hypothetical protein
MDINSPRFHEKMASGAKKTASVYQAAADYLAQNPGVGTALAVKGSLLGSHAFSAYGHHLPVIGKGIEAVGHGLAHSGLQHGLRGENPLSGLTRFGVALMDPQAKSAYEAAHSAGAALRSAGVTPGQAFTGGKNLLAQHFPGGHAEKILNPDSRVNKAFRAATTHYTPKQVVEGAGRAVRGMGSSLKRFIRE